MAKYMVKRREVHSQEISVVADSLEEALALVADGEGDEWEMYYDYTLPVDQWTVHKEYDTVACGVCGEDKRADDAHLVTQSYEDVWVCDDCWDERLR